MNFNRAVRNMTISFFELIQPLLPASVEADFRAVYRSASVDPVRPSTRFFQPLPPNLLQDLYDLIAHAGKTSLDMRRETCIYHFSAPAKASAFNDEEMNVMNKRQFGQQSLYADDDESPSVRFVCFPSVVVYRPCNRPNPRWMLDGGPEDGQGMTMRRLAKAEVVLEWRPDADMRVPGFPLPEPECREPVEGKSPAEGRSPGGLVARLTGRDKDADKGKGPAADEEARKKAVVTLKEAIELDKPSVTWTSGLFDWMKGKTKKSEQKYIFGL